MEGMVAIPYLGLEGKPLSMRFRCLKEHNHKDYDHGKYNSVFDEPPRLYGVDSIHRADDEIHIAEGEMDRIILCKAGFHAVGLPGVDAWCGRFRRMLAGFQRIWVWADPDEAGARLIDKVTRQMSRARPVRLDPEIGDVTDTYLDGGIDALMGFFEGSGK